MTGQEVTAVLAILAAAYPEKALTEEEMITWERHLATVDFDAAVQTADRLIDHQKWFPKISEFRQVAHVVGRRRSMDRPRALPEAESEQETYRKRGLANITKLRAQLRGEA